MFRYRICTRESRSGCSPPRAGRSRGDPIPRLRAQRAIGSSPLVHRCGCACRGASPGDLRQVILPPHRVNYARRLQYRRLSRAGAAAGASGGAVLLAAALGSAGARPFGGFVLVVALGLGLYSRHWLSLARRSAVGARSEDAVRRALQPLRAEGWTFRHSLSWRGVGDIDSVAIAPTGIAVAIVFCPHLARR
jgi:hypothetical protein